MGLESEAGECFIDFEYDAKTMGGLRGEDLALIGAFAKKRPYDSPIWQTYQLAVAEIAAGVGLPTPTGPQAPLLVVCDETLELVPGGMDHLLHQLGVRAILAALDDDALTVALESVPAEAGTLLLAPHATVVRGARVSSSWQIPNNATEVAAYLNVIERLAATRGALRLATLTSEAYADQALAVAVSQAFRVGNSQSISSNANFVLSDTDPEARRMVIEQVLALAPDLLLVFASGAHAQPPGAPRLLALRDLEQAWPKELPRPYYLLSPRNLGEEVSSLSSESSFPERVIELAAFREHPVAFEPKLEFVGAGQREDALRAYDGTYYLAYALARSSWLGPSGSEPLAAAMRSLVAAGSEVVQVGPGAAGLERGAALLQTGAAFQLRPTTELPSSDPDARALPLSLRAFCPAEPGSALASESPSTERTALVYDASSADFAPPATGLPGCLEKLFGGQFN